MAIFNSAGGNLNAATVCDKASMKLGQLRQAAMQAKDFCDWVNAQTADDLVALQFTADDAALLKQVCQDIDALLTFGMGGPAPAVKDYFAEALPVIGPQ